MHQNACIWCVFTVRYHFITHPCIWNFISIVIGKSVIYWPLRGHRRSWGHRSTKKAITWSKINFFQKFSVLWRIRRKLSFDTKNAEIEQKIMKSQGDRTSPLAHPCNYFWLAHRRLNIHRRSLKPTFLCRKLKFDYFRRLSIFQYFAIFCYFLLFSVEPRKKNCWLSIFCPSIFLTWMCSFNVVVLFWPMYIYLDTGIDFWCLSCLKWRTSWGLKA